MGWSFSCVDIGRAAHIAEITSQKHFAAGYTPLAHRVVGNHIWQLVRIEATGKKFITLDLIAKDRKGGWGYKGMDETWGPCYYDCPLSLLDQADPIDSDYANAWREKVRAHHAAKKARPTLAVGVVVTYGPHQYRLRKPAGPRRGWYVDRISDGCGFRITARQLADSTITQETQQ